MDDYKVTDRAYLARCREQLLTNTKQGLFYAAFELKCAVETRLAEYLEHLDSHAGKRIQPFKIGENARVIQRLRIGEIIIKMTYGAQDSDFQVTHYHTPVPETLKKYAERTVDQLRHAQNVYRKPDDPWWDATRKGLIENYRLAWIASRGTVPVPPMFDWSKAGGESMPLANSVVFLFPDGLDDSVKEFRKDRTMNLNVEYLEQPPAEWVCDL